MKAIRQHEFGGPEVLRYEDAPVPELQAGELLVRVHAVGLNPPDLYLRDGYKSLPSEWQPQAQLGDGLTRNEATARNQCATIPKACGLEAATRHQAPRHSKTHDSMSLRGAQRRSNLNRAIANRQ